MEKNPVFHGFSLAKVKIKEKDFVTVNNAFFVIDKYKTVVLIISYNYGLFPLQVHKTVELNT